MKTRYQDHMRCGVSNTCRRSCVSLVDWLCKRVMCHWDLYIQQSFLVLYHQSFELCNWCGRELSDPCAFSSSVYIIYSMCSSHLVIWSCYCRALIHDHTCFLCSFYDQTACLWFCMWPVWGPAGRVAPSTGSYCRSNSECLIAPELNIISSWILPHGQGALCAAVGHWYRRRSKCGDSSIKKEKQAALS